MSGETSSAQLRDVHGPTALGGGWRRFRELLWLMALTDFRKTYFGTVLGYVWSLMRPLMLFAVMLFVFTRVLRFGGTVNAYPVLLLFNLVLFGFFQESTGMSVGSVVAQEGIVRKTQFPRLVIPLAVVLTSLINLGLNLVAAFAFILIYGVGPLWTWLLLPLIVAPLCILTSAVALILSSLFVRFRDVGIIWTVAVTALFYGTPIFYPIELVPEQYRAFMLANPLALIIEQARVWIIDPSAPSAAEVAGGFVGMLPALAIFIFVCVAGWRIFTREAPRIAESL